jgi:riboflavin biosynthesis pyrimidine reductase
MVATIDGKTVSGERDEPVADLGSDTDHATMRQIESQSDAVLVGAGSLRATKRMNYPAELIRIVATASGDVPSDHRFFTDSPDRAFVATGGKGAARLADVQTLVFGEETIAWRPLLHKLREMGVNRLLVEGGSEINAALLREDLVDELFLTLSPKVKLGRETPTYAGGEALSRDHLLEFDLVSCLAVEDEVFVRYRRNR